MQRPHKSSQCEFKSHRAHQINRTPWSNISQGVRFMITELGHKIIALRKKGIPLKKISEELKCSKSSVSKWCAMLSNNEDIIKNNIKNRRLNVVGMASVLKEKELEIIKQSRDYKQSQQGLYNLNLRKTKKMFLIHVVNGCCQICGYNKCVDALSFHHLDPLTKLFAISGSRLLSNSLESLISEAEKCALLCHNCHTEVHSGIIECTCSLNYNDIVIPESTVIWARQKGLL